MARNLIDIPVYCKRKEDLLREITCAESLVQLNSINAEVLVIAGKEALLHEILSHSEYNIPDGFWVAKFLNLKYGLALRRISGSDLIYDLCGIAAQRGKKVFLLGGSEKVSKKAQEELRRVFRGLQVDSYAPPFTQGFGFSEDENERIIESIEQASPEMLVVCFGVPKQEYWIHKNRMLLTKLGVKAALSAGGTLDFVAGELRRAPRWLQNAGLEWFYRLCQEPEERLTRQIARLPNFLYLACIDVMKARLPIGIRVTKRFQKPNDDG